MDKIDLNELERLAKNATPGPWVANNWGRVWYTPNPDSKRLVCDTMRNTVRNPKRWRANARLIAAMRNAVPELIARIRELEKERFLIIHAIAGKYGRSEAVELQKFLEESKAEQAAKEAGE